ncbi:MAG: ABC transporter permease, partial [Brachybacterium sp.]|nr:ABC transporter permease [Brachybacterium sp.]
MTSTAASPTPTRPWQRWPLLGYVLRRLGTSVLLMLGVTMVTFVLTALVPGDPIAAALGEGAASNPATVAAYIEQHGLDKSIPERYLIYLTNLLQGDLGTSIKTGRPVATELATAVPATIEVAL